MAIFYTYKSHHLMTMQHFQWYNKTVTMLSRGTCKIPLHYTKLPGCYLVMTFPCQKWPFKINPMCENNPASVFPCSLFQLEQINVTWNKNWHSTVNYLQFDQFHCPSQTMFLRLVSGCQDLWDRLDMSIDFKYLYWWIYISLRFILLFDLLFRLASMMELGFLRLLVSHLSKDLT